MNTADRRWLRNQIQSLRNEIRQLREDVKLDTEQTLDKVLAEEAKTIFLERFVNAQSHSSPSS